MTNTFTCAICHGEFERTQTEEEALAELKENFGDIPVDECDLVCDDCWEKVKPVFTRPMIESNLHWLNRPMLGNSSTEPRGVLSSKGVIESPYPHNQKPFEFFLRSGRLVEEIPTTPRWFCTNCYRAIGKDVECYTIANVLNDPCAQCGVIDSQARYVCDGDQYLKKGL